MFTFTSSLTATPVMSTISPSAIPAIYAGRGSQLNNTERGAEVSISKVCRMNSLITSWLT
jgi:hypothetical protein